MTHKKKSQGDRGTQGEAKKKANVTRTHTRTHSLTHARTHTHTHSTRQSADTGHGTHVYVIYV